MELIGMNPKAKLEPKEKLITTYNMYLPNISVSGAKSYNELWYNEVYSNIDLRFYAAENGNLEYDYIIKPNGNIADIKYKLNGLDDLFVDKEGNLVITTSLGQISKSKPFTYQLVNGEVKSIKSSYHVSADNIVSISIDEPYNKQLPLVIDPVLLDWANMLGWYTFDEVQSAEVDASGNTFVVGRNPNGVYDGFFGTNYTDFPTTVGAFQTIGGGKVDLFVFKYGPTGTLVFSTLYGGSGNESFGSWYNFYKSAPFNLFSYYTFTRFR